MQVKPRRLACAVVIAALAAVPQADARARTTPLHTVTERADFLLSDGERYAVWGDLNSDVIQVADTVAQRRFTVREVPGCEPWPGEPHAMSSGQLLVTCFDNSGKPTRSYRIDLRSGTSHPLPTDPPPSVPEPASPTTFTQIGRTWLSDGVQTYINWHTGQRRILNDQYDVVRDLDSPKLGRVCGHPFAHGLYGPPLASYQGSLLVHNYGNRGTGDDAPVWLFHCDKPIRRLSRDGRGPSIRSNIATWVAAVHGVGDVFAYRLATRTFFRWHVPSNRNFAEAVVAAHTVNRVFIGRVLQECGDEDAIACSFRVYEARLPSR